MNWIGKFYLHTILEGETKIKLKYRGQNGRMDLRSENIGRTWENMEMQCGSSRTGTDYLEFTMYTFVLRTKKNVYRETSP